MHSHIRNLLLLAFLCLPVWLAAQNIVWQLKPTAYEQIERFGAGLYKVQQNGHIGLIRPDGTVVVPVEFDEIGKFHDHKALVLKNEAGRTLIGGYLNEQGDYLPFAKKYYTLTGQAFYSDGMLSVANEQNQVGYLNERGEEAFGFKGQFDRIKPFTEGHAAVFSKKKYALVDKQGHPQRFNIGLGEVYGGTNVCNGKAIIWDTDGKFYTYDTNTGQCADTKKINEAVFDYLYCFSSLSGRTREVPYTTLPTTGRQGLSPTAGANGLYGYQTAGRQILPCQFAAATPFIDDIAIVSLQGRKGLLRWTEGGKTFALSVATPHITYNAGTSAHCAFDLTVPEVWVGKTLEVAVTDAATQAVVDGQLSQNKYSFSLKPKGDSKSIHVAVRSEGLELWSGETTYTFKRIDPDLRVSISIDSDIANKENQIPVTATISNPGEEAVTATVHMTGSASFTEKHTTVTVPAGGSVQVHSYFHVTKDVSGQSVHVSTTKGGSASRSNLKFESYN